MSLATMRPLLRPSTTLPSPFSSTLTAAYKPIPSHFFTTSTIPARRHISAIALRPTLHPQRIAASKFSVLAATPPLPSANGSSSSSSSSSFLTPAISYVRHASTTAPITSPSNTNAAPSSTSLSPSAVTLDWNSFFRLRKSRRRYSLASSVIGALSSGSIAATALMEQSDGVEQIIKSIPMDPMVSVGLLAIGSLFLGWLIGPVVGNGLWRLFHRSRLPEFTAKERAFFQRIKKHRVDPNGASSTNPVPDYYGEKIGSVQMYRQWLKDCRVFNRKKNGTFFKGDPRA